MEVCSFPDAGAFYRAVGPLLLRHEAEYYLMIGALLQRQGKGNVDPAGGPRLLHAVFDAEEMAAAALQLPSRYLMITRAPDAAVSALAEHLWHDKAHLPGVSGPCDTAGTFAHAWSKWTARKPVLKATERIYQVSRVTTPAVSGHAEVARREDYDLLRAWWLDATGDSDASHLARCLRGGKTLLWRDPMPVSMASLTRPTPHGIGIGGVYTPPEHRRRGYGSAVVAALSQRQLEAGKRFCFLSADLANPVSDSVYRRVGYRPVGNNAGYRLY